MSTGNTRRARVYRKRNDLNTSLYTVSFHLGRDNIKRTCQIVAKQGDDIFETLQEIYEDLMLITDLEDEGECDEYGEVIG